MSTNARRGTAPAARPAPDFHALPGARHFRAADLASWPDAQRRYRELVHVRHPDRRTGTVGGAAQAEFIEITAAFKRLRERYRREGVLPIAYPPAAMAANDAVLPDASVTTDASFSSPFPERTTHREARRMRTGARRGSIVAVVLAVAAVLTLAGLAVVLDARLERLNREREHAPEERGTVAGEGLRRTGGAP